MKNNMQYNTGDYYVDNSGRNYHLLSETDSTSSSQISISTMLKENEIKTPGHQSVFCRLTQRMVAMLVNVGNYFQHGFQKISGGARSNIYPAMNSMTPLLDAHSSERAKHIMNNFRIHLSSYEGKIYGIEELVYFITLAIIQLAQSHSDKIADSRARKSACDILANDYDHPGLGLLKYIDDHCQEQKDDACKLVVLAVQIGCMARSHTLCKESDKPLNNMASLWGNLLASAATEGANVPDTGSANGGLDSVNQPSV
ncbi:hypothetical protein [Acerihabitans arboris]|uniref:Uncharacterized protein n=1 Tax=Acerihabitans arboris TaxID=2691583 RepID=A0A845SR84_9GAMM|nr:hypothetical protein [Acerihabitans arboris]NDL65617.1 hypothetical protein [Acerihabitans arboris]